MAVQLADVLLVVVQLLTREGQRLSEHSRAQNLELLRGRREERQESLLKLRRQPVVNDNRAVCVCRLN